MAFPSLKLNLSICTLHDWWVYIHTPPSLCSSLPFVLSVKFLGLILDTKLTSHLRWLCVKCKHSLNIFKNLSGRSCSTDQSVMFELYQSSVWSKITTEASFMVPPRSLSCLSQTLFTTSCYWRFLYQPSWESACGIWRAYTVPVKESSPMQLCYEVGNPVTSSLICYSVQHNFPQQVPIKHNSLSTCGCSLFPISTATYRTLFPTGSLKSRLRKLSTWPVTSNSTDFWGAPHPPSCTTGVLLLSSYLDHIAVYTNGWFLHGSTGCAFVFVTEVFSCCLHNFNSVLTAKIYALYWGPPFIRCQP
jgi:hypothetical protein